MPTPGLLDRVRGRAGGAIRGGSRNCRDAAEGRGRKSLEVSTAASMLAAQDLTPVRYE